jgi:hypothetical protein
MKLAQAGQDLGRLEQSYKADVAKIDTAQAAERSKLAVCPGEAGEPSASAVDGLALRYADRRVALAASYLPRYGAIVAGAQTAVAAEAAYADRIDASWSALESPMLRGTMQGTARGAETNAIGDIGAVLGYVEDASRPAAQAVADKNKLMRDAAQARGC